MEEARGVILHVASQLARSYPQQRLDDILAWCEDGALAAAQSYREDLEPCDEEPRDKATFVTYAWTWIWGAGRAGVQREGQMIADEVRRAIGEARRCSDAYAAEQRDAYDPYHDTEEDEERRPREALDGFAAAYIVGFSMGQPAGTPEAEHLRTEVRAAVATLNDRDEAIVTQHFFEKMTFGDISHNLPGKPAEVTVRRHFHAAMRRLSKRLGKKRE